MPMLGVLMRRHGFTPADMKEQAAAAGVPSMTLVPAEAKPPEGAVRTPLDGEKPSHSPWAIKG